jgi:hypothetical protein
MSGSLRGKLGAASKRLHEFGVKPKVERRRRLTVEQKLRQLEVKQSKLELQKQKLLQDKPGGGGNLAGSQRVAVPFP